MERWQLKLAVTGDKKLFLYAISQDLSWEVNTQKVEIQVMLNPYCEEGTWIEVNMSNTFGFLPPYVRKVVIYTSTHEAREEWRKAISASKKESYTISEVIPNKGPAKPYQPMSLTYEPDPAIKY